jgi:hypothetical protein
MNRSLAEVARSVRFLAEVTDAEVRLGSAVIHRTCASQRGRPEVREELSVVVLLLVRQHEDLIQRVRELHVAKTPIREAAELERLFVAAGASSPEQGVCVLEDSIRLRAQVARDHLGRFDAHTRLLLRVHGCLNESLLLPALARTREILEPATHPADPNWRADLESLVRGTLPGPWLHGDDFLSLSTLRAAPPSEVAS